MRASLTIGRIEVALTVPSGALETAVAQHYAPFLGAVAAPVCTLLIEGNRRDEAIEPTAACLERLSETRFRIAQPGIFGIFDLAGTGVVDVRAGHVALDNALRLLFALLAPSHGALLLYGTSVISNGGAHVFTSAEQASGLSARGNRPVLPDGLVILTRQADGWVAASTPFCAKWEQSGPPRESGVARLWHLAGNTQPGASRCSVPRFDLSEHVFLPTTEQGIRRRCLELAADLERSVPISQLPFASEAGVWRLIDTTVL